VKENDPWGLLLPSLLASRPTPFHFKENSLQICVALRGGSMASDDDIIAGIATGCVLGLFAALIELLFRLGFKVIFLLFVVSIIVTLLLGWIPRNIPSIKLPSLPPIAIGNTITYIVKSNNTRGRKCSKLNCEVVKKFNSGQEIQVSGTEQGDEVDGNNVWLRVLYNNSTIFVHSSLASPKTTPTPTVIPTPTERTAPFEFVTELSGLISCNFISTNGTGEAKAQSEIATGRLLLDLKARSLSGKAEGRAAVGIKYVAPIAGRVKIDAVVNVAGFDSLSNVSVPKLGDTSIASVQSSVEILVKRIHPARDNLQNTTFAGRIVTPSVLPIPSSPVDIVTYTPPKTFSSSMELDVLQGDQLFICAGIRSKVVAVGLLPFVSTSKVLYGPTRSGDAKLELIRISYK